MQASKPEQPKEKCISHIRADEGVIDDVEFVIDVLRALLNDLLNTLPMYKVVDYTRDVAEIEHRLRHEGVSFAAKTLPVLSDHLLRRLEGRSASFDGFKKRTTGDFPVFLGSIFAQALHAPTHEEAGPYVAAIHQFANTFKKIKGPYKRKTLRDQFTRFLQVDEEVGSIDVESSECLQPIIDRAKVYVDDFMKFVDMNDAMPRPGPGATNTPLEKNVRYEPHVWYTQIDNVMPYQEWFYPTPWDACVNSSAFLRVFATRDTKPLTSRFKFVPKTYGKARGICIEENEAQWCQQAVARVLKTAIKRHPTYRTRLSLNDQSVNAGLALSSSRSLDFATIDMSDASDRISLRLVSRLFEDHPEFRDILVGLSTRWCKPPKEARIKTQKNKSSKKRQKPFPYIYLRKYAPMGSGLCFPVMTLVHTFLLRAIIDLAHVQNCIHNSHDVYVYGDDIVLPCAYVQSVYDWLPMFGMKLNETKSFCKSFFRESCGVHAYNGIDITPIYVRKFFHPQAGALASALATEHLFFNKGYGQTCKVLREYIKKITNFKLRYVCSPTSVGYLRSRDFTERLDFKIRASRCRWNHDLQTFEYKVQVFHSATSDLRLQPLQALLRWYGLHPSVAPPKHERIPWQMEGEDSSIVGVSQEDGLSVRLGWIPEAALF